MVIISQKAFLTTYEMNSHLLSTSCLPDPVPNNLHTLINHHVLSPEADNIIPVLQRRKPGVSNLPKAMEPATAQNQDSGLGLAKSEYCVFISSAFLPMQQAG